MTLEELRALFSDMLSKNLRPMLCDAEIPLYDTTVPCGEPEMCAGDLAANRQGKMAAVLDRLKAFFQRFAGISNGDFRHDAVLGIAR